MSKIDDILEGILGGMEIRAKGLKKLASIGGEIVYNSIVADKFFEAIDHILKNRLFMKHVPAQPQPLKYDPVDFGIHNRIQTKRRRPTPQELAVMIIDDAVKEAAKFIPMAQKSESDWERDDWKRNAYLGFRRRGPKPTTKPNFPKMVRSDCFNHVVGDETIELELSYRKGYEPEIEKKVI